MIFVILCLIFPLLTECNPLDSEVSAGSNRTIDPDFEEIILINDEFMGNISDLNPFDKQVIVEKSVLYFRRHLATVGKAIRRLSDESLLEKFKEIESELDLTENIYLKDPDLERFHDAMAVFSVNLLNLQNQVLEKLIHDEGSDEEVTQDLKPHLKPRYHWDEEHFELKLHELHRYLRDFTRFVEDVIEEVDK